MQPSRLWSGESTRERDAGSSSTRLPEQLVGLRMAELAGIIPIARAHGIPAARARAMPADAGGAGADRQITRAAIDAGVTGHAVFLINGKQAPIWDWETLEPRFGRRADKVMLGEGQSCAFGG